MEGGKGKGNRRRGKGNRRRGQKREEGEGENRGRRMREVVREKVEGKLLPLHGLLTVHLPRVDGILLQQQ